MASVSMNQDLPVPAQVVWQTIGGFNALPDWHPAVENSQVDDQGGEKVRTLHLVGGGEIIEKLQQVDENERLYSYSIVSGVLPVANYTATIRVKATARGCNVEWFSEFDPSGAPENEAVAAIRGVYEAGFENLKRMFGAS